MTVVHTKTFKSGNSVAVRLPKGFAIAAGTDVQMQKKGNTLMMHIVRDPATERLAIDELVRRLREIGPRGEIEKYEPTEFPDRPGLN